MTQCIPSTRKPLESWPLPSAYGLGIIFHRSRSELHCNQACVDRRMTQHALKTVEDVDLRWIIEIELSLYLYFVHVYF